MSRGLRPMEAAPVPYIHRLFLGGFEFFERGIRPDVLGEFFLEVSQGRADRAVNSLEAEQFHLFHGLVGGPSLFRDSIRRDRHSGAVVAQAAVDEDFLPGIAFNHLQELDERLV